LRKEYKLMLVDVFTLNDRWKCLFHALYSCRLATIISIIVVAIFEQMSSIPSAFAQRVQIYVDQFLTNENVKAFLTVSASYY